MSYASVENGSNRHEGPCQACTVDHHGGKLYQVRVVTIGLLRLVLCVDCFERARLPISAHVFPRGYDEDDYAR